MATEAHSGYSRVPVCQPAASRSAGVTSAVLLLARIYGPGVSGGGGVELGMQRHC